MDLRAIRVFIAQDSPRVAEVVVARIVAATERLGSLAESGRRVPEFERPDGAFYVPAGRELFARHACARCHDVEAAGPGMVPVPLAGLGGRYGLDELASYLAAPSPPMPSFPLSDDDGRALAAHLLATHP